MTDYAIQRTIMVDSQVRPSDVTDRRIPRVMLELPREAFVPGPRHATAYADGHVPIGNDGTGSRVLLAPRLLAKMIQALDVGEGDAVLDIGCGSGYSTALLARLGRNVVAVEVDKALASRAEGALKSLGITNAKVTVAAHEMGAAAHGPYDAVLINGAVSDVPKAILDQLKDQGRLVAIRIENGVGRVSVWRRFAMQFDRRDVFDADAPLLPGFEPKAEFVF